MVNFLLCDIKKASHIIWVKIRYDLFPLYDNRVYLMFIFRDVYLKEKLKLKLEFSKNLKSNLKIHGVLTLQN